MAITKNRGRQTAVEAYVDVTFSDLTTPTSLNGVASLAIDLPVGAQVVGGDLVVGTAFNSGTSDVITVGDALIANRYLASTSIAAAGRTPLTFTGYQTLATSNKVIVTWTGVGAAPTAGAFRLRVAYIINKRASFSQG
jgi:hypothetical protein